MEPIDIDKLKPEEQDALLLELQARKVTSHLKNKEAYELFRKDFMKGVMFQAIKQHGAVVSFYNYILGEVELFKSIMSEYGQLSAKQMSFTIVDGDYKFEAKTNKVKRFDERADMAAARLITFLKTWVQTSDKGTEDPMYQLAMMAIERNYKGDLDYKQVSNLYKLEGKFNDVEYTSIMELFRESHIIEGTATHFYFYSRTENDVWKKIEISFNRL